ncbi:unnamed protein product [Gongylonema pulchrum]|uniref:Fibronectin type-III domain-containing protein n=1 Tax=Gongylonema pulchrum TaxID=637853 RepID=A0A3P7P7C7_9BILA|nr:unnamed protein product [Gongylonema pulchrum]
MSDNPDLPDSQWTYFRLNAPDTSERDQSGSTGAVQSLSLQDLLPGHTYYVRINVRKRDGEVVRASSIYRFKTMERTELLERREANTLSYRLLAPGRVQIMWTYPSSIAPSVTGTTLVYAEDRDLPLERWERVDLVDPQQI